MVIVRKAGDIIPEIVRTLPEQRNGEEKEVTPPLFCPAATALSFKLKGSCPSL
jgi:DNA ligase (NAD+)